MFFSTVIIASILLGAIVSLGVLHWRHPIGKIAAVIDGLLLVALASFVLLVLYLADSAQRGAPF